MAFKRTEDTSSAGIMYFSQSMNQKSLGDVSVYRDELESTPSEDLESSDSDRDKPLSVHRIVEAWGESTSYGPRVSTKLDESTQSLLVEEVDAPLFETEGDGDVAKKEPHNDSSLLQSLFTVHLESQSEEASSLGVDTSPSGLKRSGTLTKKESSLSPPESIPDVQSTGINNEVQVEAPSALATSSPKRNRSGTFTKDSSHLNLPSSDSDEDLESSPTQLKRSGTFTKEKPTLKQTPMEQQEDIDHSDTDEPDLDATLTPPDTDLDVTPTNLSTELPEVILHTLDGKDSDVLVPLDDYSPSSGLKRSGTFTKDRPSLQTHLCVEPASDSEEEMVDNSSPSSGLKRSGTFTKDKPSLRTRLCVESASDSEEEMVDNSSPSSGLKRSGTFTKDRPSLQTRLCVESASDSEEEMVDNSSPSSGLKRSGTFTKDKPSLRTHLNVESASDSEEDETFVLGDNSSPSSGLKRSGTFTKDKPSLQTHLNMDPTHWQ